MTPPTPDAPATGEAPTRTADGLYYPPVALPYGAAAQIARRLRPPVTVQTVCEVAKGRRQSARVRAAVERVVARDAAAA